MKYLFFIVHPSKYHVFKGTINALKSANHSVDLLITSKDILEPLIKLEGWEYTNIFPEGRKISGVPILVGAGFNAIRTIYRLIKYIRGKKYDLIITDDLLTIPGKIFNIPSIHFQDDDVDVVPETKILLSFADHILAPEITDLKKYNNKKISFQGYKELAYLHPAYFKPDIKVIEEFNPKLEKYFLIRLVSLKATHDKGKKGISDENLKTLIKYLSNYGKIYITAERPLPDAFEKYRIKLRYDKIAHALYYAQLFIGDSQTMTSEAAVLGTPAIRFNDFIGKISVMDEKEKKYMLSYGFNTNEFGDMLKKIKELLELPDLKNIFQDRRNRMLKECIDLTEFMTRLFENYPSSVYSQKKM